ncbi:MAG: 3'-5' exonuclease [Coriobacteriaceae bacterium]|jgi:DNA polymerase-3 subunit epsilon|nr:3'-5' exonuclease [Coriobacteriaceae bacterium]
MEYVALDVETANNHAGAICSIGLARFEDDELVSQYYSLIRPPEEFGEFNYYCVAVHGITPADLTESPTLAEAYDEIGGFIGDSLLVAHNSPFDSRHFHGALDFFGIRKTYHFACTLALARRTLDLPGYRLNQVCEHLGIPLGNYHNALDDAIACGKVYARLKAGTVQNAGNKG